MHFITDLLLCVAFLYLYLLLSIFSLSLLYFLAIAFESVVVDKDSVHRQCLRCHTCHIALTAENSFKFKPGEGGSGLGRLFCTVHFRQQQRGPDDTDSSNVGFRNAASIPSSISCASSASSCSCSSSSSSSSSSALPAALLPYADDHEALTSVAEQSRKMTQAAALRRQAIMKEREAEWAADEAAAKARHEAELKDGTSQWNWLAQQSGPSLSWLFFSCLLLFCLCFSLLLSCSFAL